MIAGTWLGAAAADPTQYFLNYGVVGVALVVVAGVLRYVYREYITALKARLTDAEERAERAETRADRAEAALADVNATLRQTMSALEDATSAVTDALRRRRSQ